MLSFTKRYLVAYNAIEAIGWGVVMWLSCDFYLNNDDPDANPYEIVKWPLIIFQTSALLEIVHAAIGIVPSVVFYTALQVHSRIMVVWAAMMVTTAGRESIGVPMCLFAWSLIEIIRYSYYVFYLLDKNLRFLQWLRYTAFIILYPTGTLGEFLCIYAAEREVSSTGVGILDTPDFVPFQFPFRLYLLFALTMYPPGFTQLYRHMFKQRKTVLSRYTESDVTKNDERVRTKNNWSLLLFKLLTYYINGETKQPLYEHIKWFVIILPNSAVLEILHAATGLVPSSPIVTTQQVYARVLISSGVIVPTLAAQQSVGFMLALSAWSATEVFRYSFYALNLINAVPYFLLWLRYSIFIILFPIGLSGELLLLYAAQQEFGKTGSWSLQLPNCLNFTFYFQYFLIFNIFGFIAGFPNIYLHMMSQRKKVLGKPIAEKKRS